MSALVFDFGLKYIGIALALPDYALARGLLALRAKNGVPRWEELDAVVAEWRPRQLVVGEPLNMDGTTSDMARRAHRFGGALEQRYGLPVAYADERLSTFEALSRGADVANSHARAAEVIAETWLAGQGAGRRGAGQRGAD